MTDNLQIALSHAARGWYVFPCGSDKRPLTAHGFKDATTDPETIGGWWAAHPGALVGIPAARSGFWVLDIDPPKGFESLAALVNGNGGEPITPGITQDTPRGGAHYLFRLPQDIHIPNNAGKLAPGLDLRSNGYICTGSGYTWLEGHSPDDCELTDAPSWLIDRIAALSAPRMPAVETNAQNLPKMPQEGKAQWAAGLLDRLASWRCADYQTWVDVGMSLSELGGEGLTLFDTFSQRCPEKYPGGEEIAKKWRSFDPDPGGLTLGSLYHWANEDDPRPMTTHTTTTPPEPEAPTDELQQAEQATPRVRELLSFDDCPTLPDSAHIDPAVGLGACDWLDRYIDFSRLWSPRAFDGFHEAVALWVLSTVAARRVLANMGKWRFTNLYIALTARTSLYAKSSTAEIGIQTLNRAGLSWLLTADSATPQKFITDLTNRLDDHYNELSAEEQKIKRLKLAMAGQRGWYFDEFGQHVAAMMRDGGFMSDFRGLLRRMDDTPERYEYGSIGRGSDIIERPYLALLANLTTDDLRPFARKGAGLWGDGFLARFALVCPSDGERKTERFPPGERAIPAELLTPLVNWHNRLKMPTVEIVDTADKEGSPTGRKRAEIGPICQTVLEINGDVREAFYAYHDGLLDLLGANQNHDLDGNYARFAEKALRISVVLASVSGAEQISMPHWARAQSITESWRAGLHELYRQINQPEPSDERKNEERLLITVQKLINPTAADAARYIRNLSSSEAARVLDGLVETGVLAVAATTNRRTKRYAFPSQS